MLVSLFGAHGLTGGIDLDSVPIYGMGPRIQFLTGDFFFPPTHVPREIICFFILS